MVSGGSVSDRRFAIAVRKASKIHDEGSVPATCGRDGRVETIVPRRLRVVTILGGVMMVQIDLIMSARALVFL